MRSSHVLSTSGRGRRSRARRTAGVAAITLAIAACGGGSDSSGSGAESGEPLPAVDAGEAGDAGEESTAENGAASATVGAGYVDLVGPDVIPAAEIDTNILPNVVVDDLNNDRKVNFRNLVPQDKPVLLWMYAPH